jgi:crotonobetainyl-CoA:carnitine CoA-transferase CaiB-like acyl-CoA transferase
LSGPHCTKLLAELGAEVIKIERPGVGDVVRGWDSAVKGLSSGYVFANGNKKSLAIDVKSAAGATAVKMLAERADVFLENFAPGVAARLGLGHEALCRANPRLIYCSISGYGQDGPYRDVKAYDLLIQGEAGLIATTGYPDKPAKVGVSITDLTSSMYAAVAVLGALYERERTGRGQIIDISMFESAASWLGYFPHHYWHKGEEPERVGLHHHYITPYGPYLASDGKYVNLAVATEADWEAFCRRVIERADLLQDPRFRSPELRRQNRALLEGLLELVFRERGHEEWLRRLAAARLPHGRVNGIGEVLAHPQVAEREFVRTVSSPVGPIPVVASPLRLSDSAQPSGRIPALGEDTEPLLHELGYTDADLVRFRRDHVI